MLQQISGTIRGLQQIFKNACRSIMKAVCQARPPSSLGEFKQQLHLQTSKKHAILNPILNLMQAALSPQNTSKFPSLKTTFLHFRGRIPPISLSLEVTKSTAWCEPRTSTPKRLIFLSLFQISYSSCGHKTPVFLYFTTFGCQVEERCFLGDRISPLLRRGKAQSRGDEENQRQTSALRALSETTYEHVTL